MPAHSSHLLQPLDVGCFAVLKRSYGQQVEGLMRLGISHIDKSKFLTAFQQARATTFKAETIQNSFRATGLVPYDPTQVLSQLHVQIKTPTPPGSSHSTNSSQWEFRTPQNVR